MISSLTINNFKCFKESHFPLRSLTLLTGANGAGKSSLIQSLLLFRQAENNSSLPPFVRLNGPDMLQLGQASDVLHAQAEDTVISVALTFEGYGVKILSFDAGDSESLYLNASVGGTYPTQVPLLPQSHYLNAERIGPRDTQELDSSPTPSLSVGAQGEFTAQVLAKREREKIREDLCHPHTEREEPVRLLSKQVEFWMRDLIPNIEIRTETFPGTNIAALRLRKSGLKTEWLRAPNIGFGVSYALPIIVAGLLSPPGSLFMIENPEAHLHPAGQSRMGRFLATLAAGGVQVIAETHSDHLLNGIRLAAVEPSHLLRHDQVIIHHFHGEEDAPELATAIELTSSGKLTQWPTSFFDQSEKDLAAILKARRRE